MRRLPKRWPIALYVPSVVLAVALVSLATAFADTKPYFKSFGGDVFTGGWFVRNGTCDTSSTSNYQDNRYGSPANDFYGGLLAYAKGDGSNNATGGASSQYGVFSDGKAHRDSTEQYGFYSAGAFHATPPGVPAGTTNAAKSLTFSNTVSGTDNWGGIYQGSIRQQHCIPDYYSKRPAGADNLNSGNLSPSPTSGVYMGSTSSGTNFVLRNSEIIINPGNRVTVFVNGSLYISHNICYEICDNPDNPPGYNADGIPKFTLVAQGNIYIGPGVTRLDGWYIAQPATDNASTPTADDGVIWTCHPDNQSALDDDYLVDYPGCRTNKLTINGALVAKQVNFMRGVGDVAGANNNEDALGNALSSLNIAEVINYTPEMVIGGPFFTPGATTTLKVDSLINLPPSL